MDQATIMRSDLALLGSAMVVDWVLGEPPAVVHPVVWMGRSVKAAERCVTSRDPGAELAAGAMIALLLPCVFAGGAAVLLRALERWPIVAFIAAVWLLKSTIALRALGTAAREVRDALRGGDLRAARRGLGSLCSRDASGLDEPGLVAGAVESVAENASDSVVAPLFYFALFGLPGAVLYRTVNTLDAMIGYHGRCEYLGKAAARLDDLLNLVPARLTAAFLLSAGAILGHDVRRGWRVLRRDGGKTESPNAGRPMAAMAGLLGVELEKQGHYRLGDRIEPLGTEKIDAAWRLVVVATGLAVAATIALFALKGHHAV
jgi:adenosylcobinamide-phosphate synthase